jgi:hypothetical protein
MPAASVASSEVKLPLSTRDFSVASGSSACQTQARSVSGSLETLATSSLTANLQNRSREIALPSEGWGSRPVRPPFFPTSAAFGDHGTLALLPECPQTGTLPESPSSPRKVYAALVRRRREGPAAVPRLRAIIAGNWARKHLPRLPPQSKYFAASSRKLAALATVPYVVFAPSNKTSYFSAGQGQRLAPELRNEIFQFVDLFTEQGNLDVAVTLIGRRSSSIRYSSCGVTCSF